MMSHKQKDVVHRSFQLNLLMGLESLFRLPLAINSIHFRLQPLSVVRSFFHLCFNKEKVCLESSSSDRYIRNIHIFALFSLSKEII